MKVSVICLADRPTRLPVLFWSLVAQTFEDWELLILDQSADGNVTRHLGEHWLEAVASPRRVDVRRIAQVGDWGQSAKEEAARTWATGDALLFPNDDAYYVPIALDEMVAGLEAGGDLALCGWLYDLFGYQPMAPRPAVGFVDVGGFLVRRGVFLRTGWPVKGQTGDGELVQALVAAGAQVAPVPQVLYVKN